MTDTNYPPGPRTARGTSRDPDERWAKDLLEKLAFSMVAEQRRTRRWGIFFKLLLVVYLAAILVLYWPGGIESAIQGEADHTALVDVEGIIGAGFKASADNIVSGLRDAFEDDHTKGIILRINSPGGSPVQAGYVYDEIKRLRSKYPDIPLYAVISDLCASGGYYVAAAADEIYASRTSVVGSIGVRMGGFGFVDGMQKVGVERRLLTAGEHKAFMDPFSPVKEDEKDHIQQLLDEIHQQFIQVVREGRGASLTADDKLFSGLIWTGEQGKTLGLVDAFGSAGHVAREVIGAEEIVHFTVKPQLFDRLAHKFGTAMGEGMAHSLGLEKMPRLR